MWIVPVSKPFGPSSSRTVLPRAGPPKRLVGSSTGRSAAPSSLISMPPGRPPESLSCPATLHSLQQNGGSRRSARLATRDASEGRWSAHAPQHCKCIRENLVGTYAGRGNGDYRGELASARRPISTYLKHFGLTPEVALVRLDGQYGDAAVIAQRDTRQASIW
jgi:hypothetical protein